MIDAVVSMISRLLNPNTCRHSKITWPRNRDGKCYVMCQLCYQEFEYETPLQQTPEELRRDKYLVRKAKRVLAIELREKEVSKKAPASNELVGVTSIQRRKTANG